MQEADAVMKAGYYWVRIGDALKWDAAELTEDGEWYVCGNEESWNVQEFTVGPMMEPPK